MIISVARESPDQGDVAKLIRELDAYQGALYPAESNHLLDISQLLSPSVHFFVARADGEAVGCGALRIEKEYAEVKRMYVLPRLRGHRIGRLLLEAIESDARREGVRCLRLETGHSQPEAIGLYRAFGYKTREHFGEYREDPLSLFMEKTLS